MKNHGYFWLALVLLVSTAFVAGCTVPQTAAPSPSGTPAPAAPAATSVNTAAPSVVRAADIDTTINVHFDDFACLDVQKALGKEYLYPDEKYKLTVSSPGVAGVNVNVVVVDENDQLGIRQIKPQWDGVKKKWIYEGIVPVAQVDDITTTQEKTFTIKTQSKYYICVDDRKETGVNDVMLRVPVRLQRL